MEQLVAIAAEYLPVDSVALSGIYVQSNGPILVLEKGTVLTRDRIIRLKNNLRDNRNVYVEKHYYYKLIDTGVPQPLRQEFVEKAIGYNKLVTETESILSDVSENHQVSAQKAHDATTEIHQKVDTIDTALLIQCVNGVNNIDQYLIKHSTNVALLNGMIGKWMNFDPPTLQLIIESGLLHDVGKTAVDPLILNAPRRLTEEEFEVIKQHPVFSYDIIGANKNIDPIVATTARSHHEKMTGVGYPDGLKGDDIPLFARITAISDTYDAMVSSRCYKKAMSPFYVLEQLAIGSFSELDFKIMDLFLSNMAVELLGKTVLLSNGSIGSVKYINPNKWRYPIVQVDNDIISTSETLNCVAVVL